MTDSPLFIAIDQLTESYNARIREREDGLSMEELFTERGVTYDEWLALMKWVDVTVATWILQFEEELSIPQVYTTISEFAFLAGYEYGKTRGS